MTRPLDCAAVVTFGIDRAGTRLHSGTSDCGVETSVYAYAAWERERWIFLGAHQFVVDIGSDKVQRTDEGEQGSGKRVCASSLSNSPFT